VRYGGNTSCVEVRSADGTLIVLDCGTGAHGLGHTLTSSPQRCDGHLLITHTHWDHIQGFPFFSPLDDHTIVRLLTLTLEQDGFRVVTASDGKSALRLARLERPALILLDWQMPGADGMEVTRTLRHETDPALRDVPLVLITAQSGAENTAAGFAAGVTDYLTKPFRPAHVRARVQAWLLRRRTDPEREK
jgi:CheY-like chemotaxis protein